MRIQFPMSQDGRAQFIVGADACAVLRVNRIIEEMTRAAGELRLNGALPIEENSCADPLGGLECLTADLPEGVTLSYQRSLWHKDQFAVYHNGRRTEVVYRHSGNATVTYLTY